MLVERQTLGVPTAREIAPRRYRLLSALFLTWLAVSPLPSGAVEFVQKFGSIGSGPGEFQTPTGIALDDSGRIIVASLFHDRVQIFDPLGNYITEFATRGPRGVAVDSTGRILVVEDTPGVQIFDSEGNFLQEFGSLGSNDGEFRAARGISVDSNNRIIVADTQNSRVQIFDPQGNFLKSFEVTGPGGGQPYDVAVDSMNRIITTVTNETVQVFDSNGNAIFTFGSSCDFETSNGCVDPDGPGCRELGDGQFEAPFGVAIDAEDRIYIADRDNQRIQVFNSSGGFLGKFGSKCDLQNGTSCIDPDGGGPLEIGDGQFIAAERVAIDANQRILVSDGGNHRIQIFSAFDEPVATSERPGFKCYKTRTLTKPRPPIHLVNLEDDFGLIHSQNPGNTFSLRPRPLLCVPTLVSEPCGAPLPEVPSLSCHKLKAREGFIQPSQRPQIETEDTFGTHQFELRRGMMSCVPSMLLQPQ